MPTLDRLGAVGGHAHLRNEWVDVGAMPQRMAVELVAALVDRLYAAARYRCAGEAPA